MRRRKKNVYKFGDKKHSKKGKISLALAVLSFLAGIGMVIASVKSGGNVNQYVGSAGVFSLMVSIASLLMGLVSLGEDSYKLFPILGSICSSLVLAAWTAIYIAGIK